MFTDFSLMGFVCLLNSI